MSAFGGKAEIRECPILGVLSRTPKVRFTPKLKFMNVH